jgi:hypothetical protein
MQSGDYKTARARHLLLVAMHEELRDLAKRSAPQARRLVREAYRLGERISTNATGERNPKDHGRIRDTAVDILADNLENRLGDARQTVGRRIEDVFRREGLRAAVIAANSDTEDVIAAAAGMRERLIKQGITAFEDRRGNKWQLKTYAEMAVRTNVTDALAMGAHDTLLTRGFDLVEIFSGESACPICEPYLNKTWSLTGQAKGYPVLKVRPSYHPRCDCVILPSKDAFTEREQRREEGSLAA